MPQRSYARTWAVLLVTVLLLAVPVLLWRGLVVLPHRYDQLRSQGVPVRLRILECGPGVGGDSRGVGCRVRMDYDGYSDTWDEGDVRPMASPDGTIGGVVDPRDPSVHATAYEVSRRSGAGFHGAEVFLALVCALLAAAVAVVALLRDRGTDRRAQRQE